MDPREQSVFRDLLSQVEAGSSDAAQQLMQQYGPQVLHAVRRHLPSDMRSEFDSLDFTQAVWGSFFTQRGQAAQLDEPEQLLRRLVQMARHKVLMELRKKTTAKRERKREAAQGETSEPLAPDPTPSQVAVMNDLCRKLTEGYPERQRKILEHRLQGCTREEIAELLGMNERHVRRVLDRMGQDLTGAEPDES